MPLRLVVWIMLLVLPGLAYVRADERILAFHSDIRVNADGSMQVFETIRVRSEQDRIRRGIYRDFPTRYEDRYGNRYSVDFAVTGVQRDGRDENHFSEPLANGVRTYIGREDLILPAGEYTYTIRYTTGRQLGFFEDHDELYWNVTGNGWEFPIDHASARVFLPETIPSIQIRGEAWTGLQGATLQDYREDRFRGGTIYFESTAPLAEREGLSIRVRWPKGYVAEPTRAQQLGYFYRDNRPVLLVATGLVFVLLYYLICWMRFGRDPEPGVIVAEYEPPPGYSPAALRFIERMRYDPLCFSAAIVNLAVKGYLRIVEGEPHYRLEKTGNSIEMSRGETALAARLFGGASSVTLSQSNHHAIGSAMRAHAHQLAREYEVNYFNTNSRYFVAGLILTLAVFVLALLQMPDTGQTAAGLFMMVWLGIWSFAVFFLIRQAVLAWRRIDGSVSTLAVIPATLFALVFTGAEVVALFAFGSIVGWPMIAAGLLGAGINWLFYELLKAPTLAGRRLLDRLEGFRHYLDIAERQELATHHPGGRNAKLFETYLPYALALGVEQRWAEKFADVLTRVSASGAPAYHPVWYSGAGWDHHHIGDFASSLGSGFTGAIAAASTPPGSGAGGSGGGGSSGGGGGGGGGGGW